MSELTRIVWAGLLLAVGMGSPYSSAQEFSGKVVRVADGDTITVLQKRTQVHVRLDGIDCPEKGQAYGSRAKAFTSDLVFGQVVTVWPRNKDRYGRTVAEIVLADGRDVNHELVRAGFAWWFRKYAPHDAELARLEAEARAVFDPVAHESVRLPKASEGYPRAHDLLLHRRCAMRLQTALRVQREVSGRTLVPFLLGSGETQRQLLRAMRPEP